MKRLQDMHLNYATNKGTEHSYIEIYDAGLREKQNEQFNICEIGALTCGSLKMFNDYLPHATIYGVDNWVQSTDNNVYGFDNRPIHLDEIFKDVSENYPRINLITCDSTNKNDVQIKLGNEKFDIIIDDGDHSPKGQFKTFENFFPLLSDDGKYYIEDIWEPSTLIESLNKYSNDVYKITVEEHYLHKNGRGDDVIFVITREDSL
jgi:hypothetical protein